MPYMTLTYPVLSTKGTILLGHPEEDEDVASRVREEAEAGE